MPRSLLHRLKIETERLKQATFDQLAPLSVSETLKQSTSQAACVPKCQFRGDRLPPSRLQTRVVTSQCESALSDGVCLAGAEQKGRKHHRANSINGHLIVSIECQLLEIKKFDEILIPMRGGCLRTGWGGFWLFHGNKRLGSTFP